jgi:YD repeat-containing protein
MGKTYSDDSELLYSYNDNGQLNSITNSSGVLTYSYDSNLRLSSSNWASNGDDGQNISYTYDNNGNILTRTTPAGTTTYTYDSLNRVNTVVDSDNNTIRYTYTGNGNLDTIIYPNGIEEEYNYDSLGRMIALIHKKDDVTLRSESYELDSVGNKIRISYFGVDSISEIRYIYNNLEQKIYFCEKYVVIKNYF